MKFSYSTIGDNTQENREWLEKVGYKLNYIYNDEGVVYTRCDINCYYVGLLGNIKVENIINCIGNSPLFKAVSAMREDSDYMQWFILNNKMSYRCVETGKWKETEWCVWNCNKTKCLYGHKATLTELQERFKEKEK